MFLKLDEWASVTTDLRSGEKSSRSDSHKINVETRHRIHFILQVNYITSPTATGSINQSQEDDNSSSQKSSCNHNTRLSSSVSDPGQPKPVSLGRCLPVWIRVVDYDTLSAVVKEKQLIFPVSEKTTTFSTLRPFHILVNLLVRIIQTRNYLNRYRDAVFPRNISKGFF